MGAPSIAAALDACVKVTLVLCVAALAARSMSRASAASRHLVLTLGLAAALAVPVLSALVPAWQAPFLPAGGWASLVAAPTPSPVAVSLVAPEPASASVVPPEGASDDAPATAAATPPAAPSVSTAPPRATPAFDAAALLWLAWLAGAAWMAVSLGIGTARMWWTRRGRETVSGETWHGLAREVASALGLRRPIPLVRSDRLTTPMAWGVMRPVVLLPEDADEWPEERQRAVLIHELAHVKRRDCLTQAIAHLACAVYWFHPLVWAAARRMRAERERACDDLVLSAGAAGPDYANHLLQIARNLRSSGHPALASVAMARRSQLEGRLLAILDPSLERRAPSRIAVGATIALAVAVVVPLAALDPVARPAVAAQAQVEESEAVRTPTFEAAEPASAIAGEEAGKAEPMKSAEARAEAQEREPATQAETPAPTSRADKEKVVAALAEALRDSDGEVRKEAVVALGQLRAGSAAGALAEALRDADAEVRAQAAFALGEIGSQAAADALAKVLTSDTSNEVRKQAAFALGQIRSASSEAALVKALEDTDVEVRKQAVFALGETRARGSVEPLTRMLRDSDAEVRKQAAFALGEIRDERAVAPLMAALADADEEVRSQAVFALGQLRSQRAVEGLVKALGDSNAEVRKQAAFALGEIGSREAVPRLIEALRDKDAEVRKQSAFALGEIGDARAAEALSAALKDAEAEVRKQAAFALGQLNE